MNGLSLMSNCLLIILVIGSCVKFGGLANRCNGYRRRKWTQRHEFKSWMRLVAFHRALIPFGKVWIQLFSLQLFSTADAISSGSWPILFRVLTLNVAICIVCLHFSSFCLSLSSVGDFSNTESRAPNSAGCASFLPARRAMWSWLCIYVYHCVLM